MSYQSSYQRGRELGNTLSYSDRSLNTVLYACAACTDYQSTGSPTLQPSASQLDNLLDAGFDNTLASHSEYQKHDASNNEYHMHKNSNLIEEFHFVPDQFLNEVHPVFIDDANTVKEYIKQTFELLTQEAFPNTISITICDDEKFDKIHEAQSGSKNSAHGIVGFALNRRGFGLSEIFVRKASLGRVMLTVGHEIGHVMSLPLKNIQTEEAKAYAFSIAWIKTMKEHNIANLGSVLQIKPAQNGIHDIAFSFVQQKIEHEQVEPLTLFRSLVRQEESIQAE